MLTQISQVAHLFHQIEHVVGGETVCGFEGGSLEPLAEGVAILHGNAQETVCAGLGARGASRCASGERYLSPKVAERLTDVVFNRKLETPHERLSERQFVVMRLLGGERTISKIAELPSLNRNSVSTYRAQMLDKRTLCNNADIARYAMEHQLLE